MRIHKNTNVLENNRSYVCPSSSCLPSCLCFGLGAIASAGALEQENRVWLSIFWGHRIGSFVISLGVMTQSEPENDDRN